MAKKPKTLAKDDASLEGVRMLEHEFIRQLMDHYRAEHPDSEETDEALYERLREKLVRALPRLEFNALDNLPTARALLLASQGESDKGAALLEEHYRQQQLVQQGQIQGKRSQAGNDAQAMERLAALPEGHELRKAADIEERDRIICERATQMRRDHSNLNRADIKRRLAEWARISERQIGRILSRPK